MASVPWGQEFHTQASCHGENTSNDLIPITWAMLVSKAIGPSLAYLFPPWRSFSSYVHSSHFLHFSAFSLASWHCFLSCLLHVCLFLLWAPRNALLLSGKRGAPPWTQTDRGNVPLSQCMGHTRALLRVSVQNVSIIHHHFTSSLDESYCASVFIAFSKHIIFIIQIFKNLSGFWLTGGNVKIRKPRTSWQAGWAPGGQRGECSV